ncbi:hypothetical protein [Xanthomonas axonopodis]|uniref:hypothetical protein n=1 Tax=Xanthomonas axonopodis TaxID=53413 RepID=UPI003557BFB0
MAVVQLVDLSVESEDISEFRFFKDLTKPLSDARRSISGPSGLQNLVLGGSIAGFNSYHWQISKSDWPNSRSHFVQWDSGRPVRIVFVVAWNDNGIAGDHMQPEEKFWVIHPSNGKILSVSSDVSALKAEVQRFLGGSCII